MAAEPSQHEIKSISLELVDKPTRRGRPATLTVRAFLRICHHIERGESITASCGFEGITYRGFRLRVAGNARLQERLQQAEALRLDVRREQALASIMQAGERSWMAHAWFLERVWPNEFALRTVNRIDSEQDQQLEEPIPSEVLARHRALLLELAREDEQKQANG